MLSSIRFLFLFLLCAVCTSCGSDPVAAPERVREISYELFPSTHELGASDVLRITALSADGRIRFAELPATLAQVEPGDVLLAGISQATPTGLLRVVLGVEEDDACHAVLRTAAAPLQTTGAC